MPRAEAPGGMVRGECGVARRAASAQFRLALPQMPRPVGGELQFCQINMPGVWYDYFCGAYRRLS
jgi:hypothetical protein